MLKKQKLLGIIICFVLLFISLSIEFFNKDSNPDRYKVWTEDSVLKAEDFLGQPPFYGGRQAKIYYRVKVITSPEIRVVTEMDRFQSYIKKNRISEKLIRHEAYHLNLTLALFVDVNEKILRQNLSVDESNQLTLRIYHRVKQYQKLYDKETNHSLIEAQQNYWEYKIDSIMNKSIHFPIFQEVENIEVYFPSRPKEFVLVLPDADFNGYKLEKYNMKFWIADVNMLTSDTSAIEDFWIYTIANEGHSNIVINRDYPYERSIFDSYSKDTVENEVVLDKLLLGKKSTYWLRTRYPIVEENEGVYKRKADQFFNSFKVLDE
ncbi:hypothetical protein ADIS_3592 [Lunatimonas lonarensis]|uniref:Uncharacterized protein n=1 Tax=Lunatimonas lonarensis TaxID=1232681 RepID=R7ZPQ0_9BACT|nr:hypothetical protein [Lunatimonas lonarensis]EON76004.1 hypothetical protein ADIS_3592 [Lunatimonas lonarensis]